MFNAGKKEESQNQTKFQSMQPMDSKNASDTHLHQLQTVLCNSFTDYFNSCAGTSLLAEDFFGKSLNSSSRAKNHSLAINNLISIINKFENGSTITFPYVLISSESRGEVVSSVPVFICAKKEELISILNEEKISKEPLLFQAVQIQKYIDATWNNILIGNYSLALDYAKNMNTYLSNGYNNFDERMFTLNLTSKSEMTNAISSKNPDSLTSDYSSLMLSRYENLSPQNGSKLLFIDQSFSQVAKSFYEIEKKIGDINTWDMRIANAGFIDGYATLGKTLLGDENALATFQKNLPQQKLIQSLNNTIQSFNSFEKAYSDLKRSVIFYSQDQEMLNLKLSDFVQTFALFQQYVMDTKFQAQKFDKKGISYISGWLSTLMDASLPFAVCSVVSAGAKGAAFISSFGWNATARALKPGLQELFLANLKIAGLFTGVHVSSRLTDVYDLNSAISVFESDKKFAISSVRKILDLHEKSYLDSDIRSMAFDNMLASARNSLLAIERLPAGSIDNLSVDEVATTFAKVFAFSLAFTGAHHLSKSIKTAQTGPAGANIDLLTIPKKTAQNKEITKKISDPVILDIFKKSKIHDDKNLIASISNSVENIISSKSMEKAIISEELSILEQNKLLTVELMAELDPPKMSVERMRSQLTEYQPLADDFQALLPLKNINITSLSESQLKSIISEITLKAKREPDVLDIFNPINKEANPSSLSNEQINSLILRIQQIAKSSSEKAESIIAKYSDRELKTTLNLFEPLITKIFTDKLSLEKGDLTSIINSLPESALKNDLKIIENMFLLRNKDTDAISTHIISVIPESPIKNLYLKKIELDCEIGRIPELSGNLIFQTDLTSGVLNTISKIYPGKTAFNKSKGTIQISMQMEKTSALFNQELLNMSLNEIIKNAVKYANSQVTIKVFEQNGRAKIQIINDVRPGEYSISDLQFKNALEGIKNDNATRSSTRIGVPSANKIITNGMSGKINNASTKTHTIWEVELNTPGQKSASSSSNLYSFPGAAFDPAVWNSTKEMVSSFFTNLKTSKQKPQISGSKDLIAGQSIDFGNFGVFKSNQNGWFFQPKLPTDYVLIRNNSDAIEPTSVSILNPLKNGDVILFTESGQGVMFNNNAIVNMGFQNTTFNRVSADLIVLNLNGRWAALNTSKSNQRILFRKNGQDLYLNSGNSDYLPTGIEIYPAGHSGKKYTIKDGKLQEVKPKIPGFNPYSNLGGQTKEKINQQTPNQKTPGNAQKSNPRTRAQPQKEFTPAKGYENFYNILELEQSASTQVLKSEINKMVKTYHPDSSPLVKTGVISEAFANEMMIKLNKAREVLLDSKTREKYDKTGTYVK